MKKKFLITTMLLSLFCCQIAYAESLVIADTDATEATAETVEEELDPVSHIYTFTLNGETYTLPCAVTDFTDVEGYDFETADGICPDMSIEDVKVLYGEPDSENGSYICYHFQDRYEFEDLGGLRGLGDMYAGEDGFYVYKGEEDPNIVERVDLQYFGITSDDKAE